MDKQLYTSEILSQLPNEVCYMRLGRNPTTDFELEFDNFLQDSCDKGYISQTELKFLSKNHPVMPVIYVLPNVHKALTL